MQSDPRIVSSMLTYVNYMSRFVIFCNPGSYTSAPFLPLLEAPGDQFGHQGTPGSPREGTLRSCTRLLNILNGV